MASDPIPTWYDGVLYRSKTEACYAKFFNGLDLKFEYEVQGFDTDGSWYLPDFLIFAATGPVWAEVKGSERSDPAGVERFRKFVLQRPRPSRAVLLTGRPDVRGNILVFGGNPESLEPTLGPWEDDTQEWRPCPSGHHFDLAWPGKFRGLLVEDGCAPFPGNPGEDRIVKAVLAARRARFGVHEDPGTGSAA